MTCVLRFTKANNMKHPMLRGMTTCMVSSRQVMRSQSPSLSWSSTHHSSYRIQVTSFRRATASDACSQRRPCRSKTGGFRQFPNAALSTSPTKSNNTERTLELKLDFVDPSANNRLLHHTLQVRLHGTEVTLFQARQAT